MITVIKNVSEGQDASQFTLNITNSAHPSPITGNSMGTTIDLLPGAYNVVELSSGPAGYVASYSDGCSGTSGSARTRSARSTTSSNTRR